MAGITPAGPVSGVAGLQFVDDNPEWTAEQVTGNPQQIGHQAGYWEHPVRYPGQMWSQGYGGYPTVPDPETGLIDTGVAYPLAAVAGPDTPYFDATPWTHAGPWAKLPPGDLAASNDKPDGAAFLRIQSAALHADGLDNRKPGLNIAAVQDAWAEYYTGPVDGELVTADSSQNKHVSAGYGSTDIVDHPANINAHTDWRQHFHRRVATGHNLPMDFLWMPGGQRPLVNTVHGLQALPVAAGGPFAGQDPAYGYGSAGGVLTMPSGEYQAPAQPYQPGVLAGQGLLEAPL